MSTPGTGRGTRRRGESHQRFGHVSDRHPTGTGPGGRLGTYFVRDDETGEVFSFGYADIVTEGFRTIRTGERIRFLTNPAQPGQAVYVIRLDQPDIDEYYDQAEPAR
jgi:hypothetical protein